MSPRIKPSDLLSIESMPHISGLLTPESFYLVPTQPAPLAGMSQPTVMTPWAALFHMGLQRVVCLSKEPPNYKADPLIIAGHFPLQDLYGGITPDNPKSEQTLIYEASEIISSFIQASIGIVVHCAGGTGRTRTVIGCALRMLGYNSNEILPYLDRLKRMRGARRGRPESKW